MIEALMKYLPLIILGGNIILGWALWSIKKHFVTYEACAGQKARLCERLEMSEREIVGIKGRLESLATKEDIHHLQLTVSGVQGDIKVINANIAAIGRQVHLLVRSQVEGYEE